MIPGSNEPSRQLAKNRLAVMRDFASLAMKELWCADNAPAERSTNGLMTKADPEDRNFPGHMLNQLHGNACLLRRTGPRGDDDSFWLSARNFVHGNFVVTPDLDLATELPKILQQVV